MYAVRTYQLDVMLLWRRLMLFVNSVACVAPYGIGLISVKYRSCCLIGGGPFLCSAFGLESDLTL